jgi:Chaperone of endosialidase
VSIKSASASALRWTAALCPPRRLGNRARQESRISAILAHMKMTTPIAPGSIQHSFLRRSIIFIPLALVCFAFAPEARATCQDACLTNNNTVHGDDALISVTTGDDNTAIGFQSLYTNTTGRSNTAVGPRTLITNTSGSFNVALGTSAMSHNISGDDNTALGTVALAGNTGGFQNTAVGNFALINNTTGFNNTAIGYEALGLSDTGSSNIAVGFLAGFGISHSGSNNIDIGNPGGGSESGVMRLGTEGQQTATYIAGIVTAPLTTGAAVAVGITPTGQLGVRASSARYKEAIKPMDKASEAILALKPVTFHYKKELDPKGIPQFGLVAEQVQKVNPDLVARDEEGKPYTVRYEAVNAMLLNEFLKARRQIDAQQKQIDALTAGLQNVSAQLQMTKPALQTIANNQ